MHRVRIVLFAILILNAYELCLARAHSEDSQNWTTIKTHYSAREFADAARAAEEAVKRDPERWEPLALSAWVLIAQQNYELAAERLRKCIELAPEKKAALFAECLQKCEQVSANSAAGEMVKGITRVDNPYDYRAVVSICNTTENPIEYKIRFEKPDGIWSDWTHKTLEANGTNTWEHPAAVRAQVGYNRDGGEDTEKWVSVWYVPTDKQTITMQDGKPYKFKRDSDTIPSLFEVIPKRGSAETIDEIDALLEANKQSAQELVRREAALKAKAEAFDANAGSGSDAEYEELVHQRSAVSTETEKLNAADRRLKERRRLISEGKDPNRVDFPDIGSWVE